MVGSRSSSEGTLIDTLLHNGAGAHAMIDNAVVHRIRAEVNAASGRIPSWVHVDPDVYALEQRQVFQGTWLFVAHESEIEQPNSFVTRDMGELPVIVTRDGAGVVHVLLNICTHRGMRLCQEDEGEGGFFRCPFHGFQFSTKGELKGVPFQKDAYAEGLDKDRFRLSEARVDRYRGLIFATWNEDAEPLSEHLGDMRFYLDLVVGRGEMQVVGAPQKWHVPTSWKFPSENFASDAYHTNTAHAFLAKLAMVDSVDFGRQGFHINPGQGHGLGLGTQSDGSFFPAELRDSYESSLEPRQLQLLDQLKNLHGNVFPNLSILIPNVIAMDGRRVSGTTIRQWQPIGPNQVRVLSWFLVERDAPTWWREAGRRMLVNTFGASGMFEQDDTEIWEFQTRGASALARRGDALFDYSMGLGRSPMQSFIGPGEVYDGKYSESVARSFYQRWYDLMTGGHE
jgi:phenylpropionate dioxygenase-like ring-hydroxylating dioxygenase large terminal subunit